MPIIKGLKRLIQHLTEMILDGEPMLLGMALGESRYNYAPPAIRSMSVFSQWALGAQNRFEQERAGKLGLVAFLSDIGKLLVPSGGTSSGAVYDEK